MAEIETAMEALNDRPLLFDAGEVARAGAFVSIAPDGSLRIERGYVRPEDELPIEEVQVPEADDGEVAATAPTSGEGEDGEHDPHTPAPVEAEEEDGIRPLSDRLLTELTSHRTLGLRHALGERPDIAFLAALHALALRVFYLYGSDSCIELDVKSVQFGSQAPGLNDSAAAIAVAARHQSWRDALPKESAELWDALQAFDGDTRGALFAHCVAQGVNAVHEAWNRRPRAFAHADRLAQAVELDMAAEGWTPTVDGYLGRVTKARILQAVTEAKGQRAADRIEHLKKGEMADEAEALLAGTGWLAEPLRTPSHDLVSIAHDVRLDEIEAAPVDAQSAVDGGEPAMEDQDETAEDEEVAYGPHAIAAE